MAAAVLRPRAARLTPATDAAAARRAHRTAAVLADANPEALRLTPVPWASAVGRSARVRARSVASDNPATTSAQAMARAPSTRDRRGSQVSRVVKARLV